MFIRYDDVTPLDQSIRIIGYISCFFLLGVIYLVVRSSKEHYFKLYVQNQELLGWKALMENTMPFPIMVVSLNKGGEFDS
jgi:hypothetical protein